MDTPDTGKHITCPLCFHKNQKEGEVGRACSTHWEIRNTYRVLVGKVEKKRPLGRPRRRWEYNN
jgi:hypothetical protein